MNALPHEAELRRLLQEVINEVRAPVLVTDGEGHVALCNAAGHELLARTGPAAAEAIAAASRGGANPLGLALRSGPRGTSGLLVLTAPDESTGDRRALVARRAAARWKLTRRQTQVLDELVLGRGNKDVAQNLECSPKTIELHVSAILAAAGVGSRSELLSLLLRDQ